MREYVQLAEGSDLSSALDTVGTRERVAASYVALRDLELAYRRALRQKPLRTFDLRGALSKQDGLVADYVAVTIGDDGIVAIGQLGCYFAQNLDALSVNPGVIERIQRPFAWAS